MKHEAYTDGKGVVYPCNKCGQEFPFATDTCNGVVDLGTLEVPTAEKIDEPWFFHAACLLESPNAQSGVLVFELILDLGFNIYHQIPCVLAGYQVDVNRARMVEEFAADWAANGEPNELTIETVRNTNGLWHVHVQRVELELGTLKAIGKESLGVALRDQGLAMRVKVSR